jgi:septum site-determining protein MinD
MARVIVVTSGKGGVGKTSVTSNLGVILSQKNSVCMIDADLGLKNLDAVLGIENRVIFDIEDVINGVCDINQALVRDKRNNNLYILPACKSIDIKKINYSCLEKIINNLKLKFDYILIDCPAGVERGFHNAIRCANEAIVVVTLDITSVRDADKVIGILNSNDIQDVKIIINKVNLKHIQEGISLSMSDVVDVLGVKVLGVIYQDDLVCTGNNKGVPVAHNYKSIAYKCFYNISRRLNGEFVELSKNSKISIWKRIFS